MTPLRPRSVASASIAAPPARTYRELRGERRGPNAAAFRFVGADVQEGIPSAADVPSVGEASERPAAREARAARRAYDGAPPTVPHAVNGRTLDCVGCHRDGAAIDGRLAPRPSHAPMVSCTQCHVPASSGGGIANDFEGLASRAGTRAWPGAPPTIPHDTRLRAVCDSCHGPLGRPGLRTPHPERVACTQCHVPVRAGRRGAEGEPR